MGSIAFATHAFWRDYRIVLDPARFRMVLESHVHPFSSVLIVLNNFRAHAERREAEAMAQDLCRLRLAHSYVFSSLVLSDETLISLGLSPATYWNENPNFSSAQLSALVWARGRFDYLLHMTGDAWLQKPCSWIPEALSALQDAPEISAFNLCRRGYRKNFYPSRAHAKTDQFWISENVSKAIGWGVNDLAYVLRLKPGFDWRFDLSRSLMQQIAPRWPAYARPSFEMLATAAIYENGKQIAALKPGPILKHKNFPASRLKQAFYRMMGRYQLGGRYASSH